MKDRACGIAEHEFTGPLAAWRIIPVETRHSFGTLADAHNLTRLSRSAFPSTLTDDKAMAAAAMTGDSRMPKKG